MHIFSYLNMHFLFEGWTKTAINTLPMIIQRRQKTFLIANCSLSNKKNIFKKSNQIDQQYQETWFWFSYESCNTWKVREFQNKPQKVKFQKYLASQVKEF